MSTPHIEEQGEPIHCLIKIGIDAGDRRSRELLKQEAGDLILFSVNPGPHRRISHSTIYEVDEERLRPAAGGLPYCNGKNPLRTTEPNADT